MPIEFNWKALSNDPTFYHYICDFYFDVSPQTIKFGFGRPARGVIEAWSEGRLFFFQVLCKGSDIVPKGKSCATLEEAKNAAMMAATRINRIRLEN